MHPGSLIISRDVQGRDRAYKEFRVYRDFADYEVHLFQTKLNQPNDPTGLNHLYEVIPCGLSTPVWFFADHDCKERDAAGMDENGFVEAVCRVYYDYFGIGPEEINRTLFVSSTCRPGKLSLHIKINVRTTLAEAKANAAEIAARCLDSRCRPDLSVYSSRFQQIRAAGSSKLGASQHKRPVFGRDANYADHMVRINTAVDRPTLARPLPKRSPAPPGPAAATGVRVHEEDSVRAALGASALPLFFGPAFDAGACHVEDTRMDSEDRLSCYLDGSLRRGGTLVCPFAGRAHTSNRARVCLRSLGDGRGDIEYRCLSPACRAGARRIVVPYDVRPGHSGDARSALASLAAS